MNHALPISTGLAAGSTVKYATACARIRKRGVTIGALSAPEGINAPHAAVTPIAEGGQCI